MAKKIKQVKPASPKGKKAVSKKAVTKSASSKGKKPIAKKVVKKAAVKKVVTKPAAKKVKKAPVKPVSSKGKKAAPKKVVAKKTITKKIVKASVKKVAVKKPVAKKVIANKKAAPVSWPVQLPDAIVENAANINKQMMVTGDGLNAAPLITDDPVNAFDKNVFNKATAKGDPHSNRHFSSKPKNTIKPSGKKPLW